MYDIYSISMKNKELIAELEEMPENLAKGLTGKRREIFRAVQDGKVEA